MDALLAAWESLPLWMQLLTINSLKIVALLVPLLIGVAYLTFAERKIIGYIQLRIGPNLSLIHI